MRSLIAALAALGVASTSAPAQALTSFEAEPVLRAQDLVTPELLKGPRFTVDAQAPVKGFLARFTIRSDFGTFETHGIHMLQVRVREVVALGQLEEMSARAGSRLART